MIPDETVAPPGDRPSASRNLELRRSLLRFYDRHRRELPWRGEEDPYRIWISEVMLQQTRVETVIPYYRRWMERFPGLGALADAPREDVLHAWKGLGYYSRARNLHRAARIVREEHGGLLPPSVEGLRSLPGVGEYTAGAVASIAFDVPVPAVDGNVRRVLARLDDRPDPTPVWLRRRAGQLLDPKRPGAFNQALMELGATICTPRSPSCRRCPVRSFCLARSRGTVNERPAPRGRGPVTRGSVIVVVPVDGRGRTLVVRRPEDGLLGGMWEFPSGPLRRSAADGSAEEEGSSRDDAEAPTAEEDAYRLLREIGVVRRDERVGGGDPLLALEPVEHAFTHLRLTYRPFLVPMPDLAFQTGDGGDGAGGTDGAGDGLGSRSGEDVEHGGDGRIPGASARVAPLGALGDVPLSSAQQKIAERVRGEGISFEGPARRRVSLRPPEARR